MHILFDQCSAVTLLEELHVAAVQAIAGNAPQLQGTSISTTAESLIQALASAKAVH
jgi:hypothetical protein